MASKVLTAQSTIAAAGTVTGDAVSGFGYATSVALQAKFAYGAGGTAVKAYVQTSLDQGVTWFDIACFAFTTSAATKVSSITTRIAPASQAFAPTDVTLTDNTIIQGVIGDQLRCKYVSTGTYTGTTHLTVTAVSK